MTSYEADAPRRKIRTGTGTSGSRRSNLSSGQSSGSLRRLGRGSGKSQGFAAILREPATLICFAFVAICMGFGGGPGELGVSFLLIAVSGLVLLVAAVRGPGARTFQALPRIVRLAVALAVALPFIQLIPLPPGTWQALPGHGLRAAILQAFGQSDAWMPLSITPAETAYSAVIALAMLGLFMTVLALPQDRMRALVVVILIMIGLGAAIGMMQFASGGDSLQFHDVAHRYALIGFFANKNHMGLTLACVVPLSLLLFEHQLDGRRGVWILEGIGWLGLLALLIAANSRAALLLALFAMFAVGLRVFPQHRKKVFMAGAAMAGVIIALASFIPAMRDVADRFGRTGEDLRFDILDQGMPLITQFAALGSGLGSFVAVYTPTERLDWVNPAYVNHLHNDWLQMIIEAGIPGVIVMLLMVAAVAVAGLAWRRSTSKQPGGLMVLSGDERSYAWAGFIIIAMFAAHSIGDYPLRRVGTLVLFVVALAMVFRLCINPAHKRR